MTKTEIQEAIETLTAACATISYRRDRTEREIAQSSKRTKREVLIMLGGYSRDVLLFDRLLRLKDRIEAENPTHPPDDPVAQA